MADVKDVKDTCAPRSNRRDKQVYTYDAKWDIYALNWSNRAGDEYAFRFAIGSFIEEYRNKIKIIQLNTDEAGPEFFELAEFDHPYPATKVMWHPPKNMKRDLLATTGDYLRLWSVRDKEVVKLEGVFSNVSLDQGAIRSSLVVTLARYVAAVTLEPIGSFPLPLVFGPVLIPSPPLGMLRMLRGNGVLRSDILLEMQNAKQGAEVNQVRWSAANPDFITIAFNNKM
ncbi:wdr68, partial [Symbiodinium sp. KB8]